MSESKHLQVPDNQDYEYALQQAYDMARERLGTTDALEQCRRVSAECHATPDGISAFIRFLDARYELRLPEAGVLRVDGHPVPLREKLLILHYFITGKGTPFANSPITYKELPGGHVYYPTFAKRAVAPILKNFGAEPGLLVEAAGKMGGRKAEYGDVSVTILAFPRVPVTVVIWKGEEDLGPEGSLVFDASITDYLSSEDITVLSETIAWRLVSFLKERRAAGR